MPGYKAHLAGGAVAAGLGLAAVHWLELARWSPGLMAGLLVAAMAGALVPDIDTDSKGQHVFYALLIVADLVLIITRHFQWAAMVGLLAMLPAAGRHRGWTHTWWAGLLLPAPLFLLPLLLPDMTWREVLPFYAATVAGYGSHLVLDGKG